MVEAPKKNLISPLIEVLQKKSSQIRNPEKISVRTDTFLESFWAIFKFDGTMVVAPD